MRQRLFALVMAVGVAASGSTVGIAAGGATAAHAQPAADTAANTAPAEFGTDWADPRTAAPPVDRPDTRHCDLTLVQHAFVNYDVFGTDYQPPAGCSGPWAKVVLRLDGAVSGRQFDRLGWLAIGGVTVLKTSTPEPSVDGIRWSVEKDLSGYGPLLRSPQRVEMFLGNIVDDTYTGILDITVSLTFYVADRHHPAASTATDVLALADQHRDSADLTGTATLPRNTERLVAEVYASGSGGGCEEFWYLTTPATAGYSCQADHGPYREVQVLLDGRLAGIAAPYPHIYTGGWSNPFLWYVLSAPRAMDLHPIRYDLTPFVGLLTDGAPHTVTVHVVGVPAGQPGWDTPVNLLAWRDPGSSRVTGSVLHVDNGDLSNDSTFSSADGTAQVATRASHRLRVAGVVRTSHGPVTTTVERRLANSSTHRWGADENPDALQATWTDEVTTTVAGASAPAERSHTANRYGIDGNITVSPENRLTTTITVTDTGSTRLDTGWYHQSSTMDDTYRGEASWTLNVPRDQRHAVGTSEERFRLGGDTCYDHAIGTRNGSIVLDRRRC